MQLSHLLYFLSKRANDELSKNNSDQIIQVNTTYTFKLLENVERPFRFLRLMKSSLTLNQK